MASSAGAARRRGRRSRGIARRCDGGAAADPARLAGDERGVDGGASLDFGIGGSRTPEQLKCLHAHVAYALARPGYELGERILDEFVEPWPARSLLLRVAS